MCGSGHCKQDAGCKIQDAGYRMQDAGYRMQDAGHCGTCCVCNPVARIQIRFRYVSERMWITFATANREHGTGTKN
jgi:hypothetical protein